MVYATRTSETLMDEFLVLLILLFLESRTLMWVSMGESFDVAYTLAMKDAEGEFGILFIEG